MQAKYSQTKSETVTLLRLVLAEMGKHEAGFNPIAFAVWYEHIAGINPPLSVAMAAAIERKTRLDDADIADLHAAHVAEATAHATDSARVGLQRVLSDMARSAEVTGQNAQEYGDKLLSLSRAMDSSPSSDGGQQFRPQLSECVDGTLQMRTAVDILHRALSDGEAEIERLRTALDRTRTEAVTDPLSKLSNRRGFDEAIRAMVQQHQKAGLVIFDIDHFKRFNDGHGHAVGDMVIEAVGQVLTRVSQPAGMLGARIGGEEFALLVPNTTIEAARQIAQSVCAMVRNMSLKKRGTQEVVGKVTLSAGIALWMRGDDPTSFLAAADKALYLSKEMGRDCISVA